MEDFSHKVTITADKDGFHGRECPAQHCKKYFKIQFGTGLKDVSHCFCPYCGHKGEQNEFFTQEQIDYAISLGTNAILEHIKPEFKKLEGTFGSGLFSLKMKVDTSGLHVPILQYYEKELETIVVCESCTLRYTIYGIFGYCPDCGIHNSNQIFKTNMQTIDVYLALAMNADSSTSESLVGDALGNLITQFEAFGKATFEVMNVRFKDQELIGRPRFQDIVNTRDWFQKNMGFDLAGSLTDKEWKAVICCFQKRHVFTHLAGVADQAYLDKTDDETTEIGRKIRITKEEVTELQSRLSGFAQVLWERAHQ